MRSITSIQGPEFWIFAEYQRVGMFMKPVEANAVSMISSLRWQRRSSAAPTQRKQLDGQAVPLSIRVDHLPSPFERKILSAAGVIKSATLGP